MFRSPAKQARPSDADLKQLADLLDKKADHTPYPFIGEHLPEKGRVRNSERYVIGPLSLAHFVPLGTDDWMGYDHSAETILARYQVAGKDETLLITSYPTQQVAAAEFAGMLRRFIFDPPGGVPPGQNVLFGKRVSSYIAVVVGAPSRQAANKVLDQVGYESNVTWDEPKQTSDRAGHQQHDRGSVSGNRSDHGFCGCRGNRLWRNSRAGKNFPSQQDF